MAKRQKTNYPNMHYTNHNAKQHNTQNQASKTTQTKHTKQGKKNKPTKINEAKPTNSQRSRIEGILDKTSTTNQKP